MKTEACRVVIFLFLARCQGSKNDIKSELLGRKNVEAGTEFDHLKTEVEREKIYGVPENVEVKNLNKMFNIQECTVVTRKLWNSCRLTSSFKCKISQNSTF